MATRSFAPQANFSNPYGGESQSNGSTTNSRVERERSEQDAEDGVDPNGEDGVGFDGDRNALVQHDQLQMHQPIRPQTLEVNGRLTDSDSSNMTPTRSSTDLPYTVGNTARRDDGALLYRELHDEQQRGGERTASDLLPHLSQQRRQQWESNYKEAAIFLEEGENNDKFTHHPRSFDHLPAYLLVHNKWFNAIDLGAAMVLLLLGYIEEPRLAIFDGVPIQVHAAIELCALILIGVQVGLKTRWIGWRTFMLHKRTAIKVGTLSIMIIEAFVVMFRSTNHFRITRALRPIFLIDNHFCGGVRRFIRQILQSLPPILDMLGLVFFVMLIFSVFGFYLFGDIDTENFSSLFKSFVSLFVLLTTANYPDVMMKSYAVSSWSAAFFICYLSVNLYFLMNLMLAVVYDAFTRIEKEKFRRLFLHKRKAAQHAFKLLVTRERPEEVSFQHFEGLLTFYKPTATPTESYLIFKLLNTSKSGYLTKDEFYDVYDACVYTWNIGRSMDVPWYHTMRPSIRRILGFISRVVVSSYFEYAVYLAVLTNGVVLIVQTASLSSPDDTTSSIYTPWVNYFFVGLYTLEASVKLLGLGSTKYFSSNWNLFDFCVTILGILALVFEFIEIPLSYVIILRPLRLLTLFRMKKRFRDVFGTAVILLPRLISAVIVLLLIYYFFAIIGMECFQNYNGLLKNCCNGSSVEQYFKYEKNSNSNAFFYLNDFSSLAISGVTLFELTVVNNWFIIMEGYAYVTGKEYSRAFFMTFYIFTMIVMTIIVAFILEAFLFRIQFKEFLTKQDEVKKLTAEINLSSEEVEALIQRKRNGEAGASGDPRQGVAPNSTFRFVGQKSRTKEQLQKLMYAEEMDQWLAEERLEEARSQARLVAALLRDRNQSGEGDDQDLVEEAGPVTSEAVPDVAINTGETVQVVEDEDEVTTIRRPILPDVRA